MRRGKGILYTHFPSPFPPPTVVLSLNLPAISSIQTSNGMFPNIFSHCYPTPRWTVNELSNLPDILKAFICIAHTAGDGSVGTTNRLWVGRYTSSFLEGVETFFLFSKYSRLVLGPTQWVPGFFPEGKIDRGVKYVTHLHLVPRLRISGALPLRNHGADIVDFHFFI